MCLRVPDIITEYREIKYYNGNIVTENILYVLYITVAQMADTPAEDSSVYWLPSVLIGKRRWPSLPAIIGGGGYPLAKPEE